MKDLITITKQTIGNEEINAVDARKLWAFLEVETKFADWINRRIKEYNFMQDIDFIAIPNPEFSPPRKEYTISIDMAKELSMVERNAKGKEARKYFIQCEKDLTTPPQIMTPSALLKEELTIFELLEVPKHLAQIESIKQVKKLSGVDLSYAILLAPAQNEIKAESVMLEPTELGKHFNLSGVKMNKRLRSLDLQYKNGEDWKPTEEGEKISSRHSWSAGNKSGYNLKWNLAEIKRLVK